MDCIYVYFVVVVVVCVLIFLQLTRFMYLFSMVVFFSQLLYSYFNSLYNSCA